jgi:hypothetical protein
MTTSPDTTTELDLRTITASEVALRATDGSGEMIIARVKSTDFGELNLLPYRLWALATLEDGILSVETNKTTHATIEHGRYEVIWQGEIPSATKWDYARMQGWVEGEIKDGRSGLIAYEDMDVSLPRSLLIKLADEIARHEPEDPKVRNLVSQARYYSKF